MRASGQTCDRAREWASLRMDSELSELESALLDAHLKRCDSCRAFAQGVESVALQLRAAALERLEEPVTLPVRRPASAHRVVQLGAAAALVAAAAGLGTLFGALGPHTSRPVPATTAPLVSSQLSGSLAFAVDERPRGLPQYPSRDYIPRKGLALGTAEV
jgi:predicted anti-sigma-YlaC factor YlaD